MNVFLGHIMGAMYAYYSSPGWMVWEMQRHGGESEQRRAVLRWKLWAQRETVESSMNCDQKVRLIWMVKPLLMMGFAFINQESVMNWLETIYVSFHGGRKIQIQRGATTVPWDVEVNEGSASSIPYKTSKSLPLFRMCWGACQESSKTSSPIGFI